MNFDFTCLVREFAIRIMWFAFACMLLLVRRRRRNCCRVLSCLPLLGFVRLCRLTFLCVLFRFSTDSYLIYSRERIFVAFMIVDYFQVAVIFILVFLCIPRPSAHTTMTDHLRSNKSIKMNKSGRNVPLSVKWCLMRCRQHRKTFKSHFARNPFDFN